MDPPASCQVSSRKLRENVAIFCGIREGKARGPSSLLLNTGDVRFDASRASFRECCVEVERTRPLDSHLILVIGGLTRAKLLIMRERVPRNALPGLWAFVQRSRSYSFSISISLVRWLSIGG
jgi:hypothetical protein